MESMPSSWLPDVGQIVGLTEYTNANFFSKDTTIDTVVFDTYPHPSLFDTNFLNIKLSDLETIDAEDGKIDRRIYISKVAGEPIKHLAAISYLHIDLLNLNIYKNTGFRLFFLDDKCFEEYASHLVPMAVGYDTALLNYFFRGDIKLKYETGTNPGYVFVNNTGEKMEGDFTIYYDTVNDERFPVWSGKGTLEATIGDKTNTFDFIPPSDAKEPGKYIVVFKGKMGNEEGAVVGNISGRFLEITPPSQFVYSLIDATQNPQQFTNIKAKVRNASPDEGMRNGTIKAVAKYKTSTTQTDFTYSSSIPISISSLSSDAPSEFEFGFTNEPIPISISDLSLEVRFTGKVGDEDNAVAIGIRRHQRADSDRRFQ